MELKESILCNINKSFSLGGCYFNVPRELCVSNMDGLRNQILKEANSSRYSIYPGSTKMYHELKICIWLG